jgi:hypothetical protein
VTVTGMPCPLSSGSHSNTITRARAGPRGMEAGGECLCRERRGRASEALTQLNGKLAIRVRNDGVGQAADTGEGLCTVAGAL